MPRFNDFLKFLLAIVVTQFIRESDEIRANLTTLFCGRAPWVAEITPFVLALISVRNVHASVLYDEATKDGRFQPSYERYLYGRFLIFILHLLAFVGAPFAAEHLLAHHAATASALIMVATKLAIVAPFILYLIWDIAIWLGTEGQRSTDDLQLVVSNWLRVDAAGLAAILIALFVWLVFGSRGVDMPPDYYFMVFILANLTILVLDYRINRRFYFPPPSRGRGSPEMDSLDEWAAV